MKVGQISKLWVLCAVFIISLLLLSCAFVSPKADIKYSGSLEIHTYPDPGKITVTIDHRLIQSMPLGTRLRADLCLSESNKPIIQKIISDISNETDVEFDMKILQAGEYAIHVNVIGLDGTVIREEASSTFFWKGQSETFKNVKILNNFVWELLNVEENAILNVPNRHTFHNPCDRWVYIRTQAEITKDGEAWVSIDSNSREEAIIVHSDSTEPSLEAMRFLSAGKHTIFVGRKGNAVLKHLIVRSIPMLQYAFYGLHPHIHPYGPYDWKFLSKDILPNVNVMISEGPEPPHLREWKNAGKKWISIAYLPKLKKNGEATADGVYKYWSNYLGLQHPLMDGIIVDEFIGGDDIVYGLYREAVERIYSNPKFKGKSFMPYYGGTFNGADRSTEFLKTCIERGGYIVWERYLTEQPTQEKAMAFIKLSLLKEMGRWEDNLPGSTRRMVMALGCMSQPTESLNTDPTVNFKVYMDIQFRFLATHPAFFGLGGIQEYHSSYCDEESIRWAGRLYRHYCIEGNTEPLAKDPYKLTHIENPDFAVGEDAWTVLPAEEESAKPLTYNGYSWLQGRYPRTNNGDTFLWMKRSARKANTFTQEIKDLTPGRLYSLKMITGDYQDLVRERSVKADHTLSIQIDNADLLSGQKKAFEFIFSNNYAHTLGKFNQKYPYWMNYHWRVFRAQGTTARLTVKDWRDDEKPGGPIGQELIFNFIEIQPYLDE